MHRVLYRVRPLPSHVPEPEQPMEQRESTPMVSPPPFEDLSCPSVDHSDGDGDGDTVIVGRPTVRTCSPAPAARIAVSPRGSANPLP